MLIFLATFLVGLVGLLLGGSLVVRGASRLGLRLGLTPSVVGLTIVAAGTSAPELAVVFQSLAVDDAPLAVGSIIGSNIANVLLVLGLTAMLGAITVTSRMVRIDIPIMIAASVGLLLLSLDERLDRLDGAVLLASLLTFVGWTLRSSMRAGVEAAGADTQVDSGREGRRLEGSVLVDLGSVVAGVALLAVAAQFVVSGAEEIARALGVPELIVGLSIVALGTSAPEIATTVLAAIRGERDLAVGNAVGSNIFNILLVLGAGGLVAGEGLVVGPDAVGLDVPILVAAAFACLPMVLWDNRLDRWEGGVFVAYYVAYMLFLVFDATGHTVAERFGFVMVFFVIPLTLITVLVVALHRRRRLLSVTGTGDRP